MSNNYLITSVCFLVIFLASCTEESCDKSNINGFDNFLGLSMKHKEKDLVPVLGEQTYGYYSEDSSAFIYQYSKVENVPISVWVNSETGDIETIFMEVLGINSFDDDIELVKDAFEMADCDAQYFGMMDLDIIEILGKPAVIDEDLLGVRHLNYTSNKSNIQIGFSFYPEQDFKCSGISVNWFY